VLEPLLTQPVLLRILPVRSVAQERTPWKAVPSACLVKKECIRALWVLDIVWNAPKAPIPLKKVQVPIPPACLAPLARILKPMALPQITLV